MIDIDVSRDDAIGVIQCASGKCPDAGHFVADDGRKVLFVADPVEAPTSRSLRYVRPDDAASAGDTYREQLERYNRDNRTDNPWGLLPAWRLYKPREYWTLVDALGVDNVFILSAGWGLVAADYLLPNYDITFSRNVRGRDAYKRRKPSDRRYRDFSMLPQNVAKTRLFLRRQGLHCAILQANRQRPAAHCLR